MKIQFFKDEFVCPICRNVIDMHDYKGFRIFKTLSVIILLVIYNLCIVPLIYSLFPNISRIINLFIDAFIFMVMVLIYHVVYKYVTARIYNKHNKENKRNM